MGNKCDEESISIERKEDEMWAIYGTRAARVAMKIWAKMNLPFLSEVIAESLWRAMGWVCDERPDAVINTSKQVFKWRSTKLRQSTEAIETKNPYNHTRRKHKWGWHHRGCVWDKVAAEKGWG